ncbi:MAG: M1 family metallopeptidase [Chitinophagaceae bacterium]|nr:M1 family metallopeptidase [Chitinophagaceae bacterium]MBP6477226.1 M1 family metallopeptidase [Chitinophagaceae bacterium]MBP7107521.1 M1 family metallopeptidase [Chitinophagaceae bacterium]MBP7315099.1 M1 family metallopeptidase [Chitinophagaceae bacterium]
MKTYILSVLILISVATIAQEPYWQQELRYTIYATLNDKDNSITANETIVYKNNAPSSLDFIWFHLWPNAYKDESTALFQQIKNDESRSKKLKDPKYGYIDQLAFKVKGVAAKTEAHPKHIDIIKLLLDKPLASGDSITIATPFHVVLPSYFSRSGYADGEFMACQWYPKPAVYDKNGWHEMPYLDMGEFYSEYATFNVTLTVPSDFIVAATGTLQTKAELDTYKKTGAANTVSRSNKPVLYQPATKGGNKTLSYYAEQVPDFAWFADKDFVIQYDTVQLSSGKVVDAFSYYHNKKKTLWDNSIDYVKDATRKYSEWVGEYAYPVVQAVEGPANNSSGGMEYPMVTLITSPDAKVETLDGVIAHEVGHNWFMAILGSNERMHTWMDEGLNSYYHFRYEAEKYRYNSIFGDAMPKEVRDLPVDKFQETVYTVIDKNLPMESAMETPADKFPNSDEYGLVSYVKTALWLYLLESSVGREKLDAAMQNYYQQWKFKHPQPEDMQKAFEEAIGGNLDQFFKLTKKKGRLE